MRKISIIIVTYKSNEIIKDCIDSIFKYNDIGEKNLEVIVVDNSPAEISKKMFQDLYLHYGEKIKLIKNKGNFGYGQGNNIGIENSSGDIICIMNPDVRLIMPIFSKTINEFDNNKKLALLGYKQVGGVNLSFYFKPEYYIPIANSLLIKILNKINIFSPKHMFLSGALFFVDKNKFEKIGKFDDNIFLYLEEPDISNRMLNKGFEIKYNKKYKYMHLIEERNHYNEVTLLNSLNSSNYYHQKFKLNWEIYLRKLIIDTKFKIFISKLLLRHQLKNEFERILKLYKQIKSVPL
jgi:hypothetical protein